MLLYLASYTNIMYPPSPFMAFRSALESASASKDGKGFTVPSRICNIMSRMIFCWLVLWNTAIAGKYCGVLLLLASTVEYCYCWLVLWSIAIAGKYCGVLLLLASTVEYCYCWLVLRSTAIAG